MTEPDGQNERQGQRAVRLTMAKDGSGDYGTVGAALEALEDKEGPPSCILIKESVYRGRLEIRRPGITLKGQSAGGIAIIGGLSAGVAMEDGSKRGTFRIYSVLIDTHDFAAKNLAIEDSAGPDEAVRQALILYADEDRVLLRGCKLLGGQDTLLTDPLPPRGMRENGPIEPKRFPPRISGRRYYQDCFVHEDMDPISGSTTTYLGRRELYSVDRDTERKGYVTTTSTSKGQRYGYVFQDCRFTEDSPCESVYLDRSWRDYARTVFIDYYLGPHICRERWHDWDKGNARPTLFYGEYGGYGPGAEERETVEQGKRDHCAPRPDQISILTHEQI